MDDKKLNQIFNDVFKAHGYENVSAEFAEFAEMKIKWRRDWKTATFEVSDYLMTAPEEVIEAYAEAACERIWGGHGEYPKVAKEYVASEEFRDANQEKYVSRIRGTVDGDEQNGVSLKEAVAKAENLTGISADGAVFLWNGSKGRAAQTASAYMRVGRINVLVPTCSDDEDMRFDATVLACAMALLHMAYFDDKDAYSAEAEELLGRMQGACDALRRCAINVQ